MANGEAPVWDEEKSEYLQKLQLPSEASRQEAIKWLLENGSTIEDVLYYLDNPDPNSDVAITTKPAMEIATAMLALGWLDNLEIGN